MLDATRNRLRQGAARCREIADGIPLVGHLIGEWRRIEVIDRATVTAAQALLALVPMVVVLIAFLPADLTHAGLDRFAEVTGIARSTLDASAVSLGDATTAADVRAQSGVVGLVVAVISASSFARALMRAYERVWDLPSVTGIRARRTALSWLLPWLLAIQLLESLDVTEVHRVPAVLTASFLAGLVALLWWWSLRVLLSGRVPWQDLVAPAALTGVALVVFVRLSAIVMPTYSRQSTEQFGAFGLVLTLATWLVAASNVVVICAILGRMLTEWLARRRASGQRLQLRLIRGG